MWVIHYTGFGGCFVYYMEKNEFGRIDFGQVIDMYYVDYAKRLHIHPQQYNVTPYGGERWEFV